jgi:hypothetical protein
LAEDFAADRFVEELRLEAAAVRVPLLALFEAPDFFDDVDFDADFFAPDFDADFFAPPFADFDADLVPRALLFDADFFAPPLLDFDVVAFAITTSLREPLAQP